MWARTIKVNEAEVFEEKGKIKEGQDKAARTDRYQDGVVPLQDDGSQG